MQREGQKAQPAAEGKAGRGHVPTFQETWAGCCGCVPGTSLGSFSNESSLVMCGAFCMQLRVTCTLKKQKWNRFGEISSNGGYTFGMLRLRAASMQPKVQIPNKTHAQATVFINPESYLT